MVNEMESDYYSLSWDNFRSTISSGFKSLLKDESFVDVTLATEGKFIKAHKFVLSICSSFFKDLFEANPCQHPIVILPNGEVSVSQDQISSFIKVAEMLKIKGLTDNSCKSRTLNDNNLNSKVSQKSNLEKTVNKDNMESMNEPKEEPLDSESNTTFEKFEDNIMDYEDEPQATSPDFVDILSLKTEVNTENLISDDDLGESSASQNTETELQANQIDKLPDKSKELYLREYSVYKEWCEQKNLETATEEAMFEYLDEKSKVMKASSLWSKYSMLKAVLAAQDNIHITFPKVLQFLKTKGRDSISKKTRTFTLEDINKFLIEAPDIVYLMMKVVLIFGVAGACRTQELTMMRTKDIEDRESILIIRIPGEGNRTQRTFIVNNKSNYGINLIAIYRKYLALRKPKTEHDRLFVNYREGKCSVQVVGKNSICAIPRLIAKYLQKPHLHEYTGSTLRKTSRKLMTDSGLVL